MKRLIRLIETPVVLVFFYFTFPETLDAYLDPGTGSIIISAVIGVTAGGLLAVGLFWNRTKAFFRNLFSKGEKHENEREQH